MSKKISAEEFRGSVDRRLSGLKADPWLARRVIAYGEGDIRMKKISFVTVFALVLLVIGTTAALASAVHWGIFDFLSEDDSGLRVSDDAGEIVRYDLGTAREHGAVFELKEMAFDGKGVFLTLYAEPEEEGAWLGAQEIEYDENELYGTGDPSIVLDGVITLECEGCMIREQRMAWHQEEKGVTIFWQGIIEEAGNMKETLEGHVVYTDFFDEADGWTVSIPFAIDSQSGTLLTLVPDPYDGLEILGIKLLHNRVADYVEITYRSDFDKGDDVPFGINDDSTYYATEKGHFYHTVSDCSGMSNAQEYTGSQIRETGKAPCPICIGQPYTSGFTGYDWHFDLLDENGNRMDCFSYSAVCADDKETYTANMILPRQAVREDYVLRINKIDGGEESLDIICHTNGDR